MKSKLTYLSLISGLIICLDQITKLYVHTQFQINESIPVIQNYFHITYVRNFGAAFGILAQTPHSFREVFFLLTPPIACILVLYILFKTPAQHKLQIMALSSIFGGAIGNYIDRVQYNYVVDFIDFHYYQIQTFPAFNIADVAIVVGVFILLYLIFKEHQSENQKN